MRHDVAGAQNVEYLRERRRGGADVHHHGQSGSLAGFDSAPYRLETVFADDDPLLSNLDPDDEVGVLDRRANGFLDVQVCQVDGFAFGPAGQTDGRDVNEREHTGSTRVHNQMPEAFDGVRARVARADDRGDAGPRRCLIGRNREWAHAAIRARACRSVRV